MIDQITLNQELVKCGVEVDADPDSNTLEVKVLFEISGLDVPHSIIHLFIRTNEIICPLLSLQI